MIRIQLPHSNQKKTKKKPSFVQKLIDEKVVGEIRSINTRVGMIRLRKIVSTPNTEWELQLFDGACRLSEVY
jgi:hypothetical protein